MKYFVSCLAFALSSTSWAVAPVEAPTDPAHPGSKIYLATVSETRLKCNGRSVDVFTPAELNVTVPAVVFGHGQALDLKHYRKTFEHLAKKGVAVIFPTYDTGFFDQDWQRMGRDYVSLTDCALKQTPQIDRQKLVFSGHSKGAYVASIAAGLSTEMNVNIEPQSAVLFEAAGADSVSLAKINPNLSLTVVFSEADTTVKRNLSEQIYAGAKSDVKQFIFLKNYADRKADHMWPLTESTLFGGGAEGPFHYYGSWKWLVAAGEDLGAAKRNTNPYLYGEEAGDKGDGTKDEIRRSFR